MTGSRIRRALVLAGAFAGCGAIYAAAVTSATSRTGEYADSRLGELHQPTNETPADGSGYEVPAYPLHTAQLAEGDGRAETESFCSQCHSTRYILMQPPLPADTWEAEVNKMIKTYGAAIPAAPVQKIVQYLRTHYTPETRQR